MPEGGSSVEAFFIRKKHGLQQPKGLELRSTQKLWPCSLKNGITIQLKEKVKV